MAKKNQKIFGYIICLFVFLSFCSFVLPINKVSAVGLEVSYPVIKGQNINAETNLTLPSYAKYLFNAGMFLGFFAVFISLIIAGVMYFLSPINPEFLSSARDRIGGAISGLLILLLTYLIITTISPQLSIFNFNQPLSLACNNSNQCVSGGTGATCTSDTDCSPKKAPGVYFYKGTSCPASENPPANTSNVPDLGKLKNVVNSIGIMQDIDNQTFYITILYSNPDLSNLWGKCQYITTTDPNSPTQTCQNVDNFASSASVYPFDANPDGDGVYFYRKSCFNNPPSYVTNDLIAQCNANSGGYYEVTNEEIKNEGSSSLYEADLNQLQFTGDDTSNDCTVPESEQDCTAYDKNGVCTQKSCPTLAGENISSMIIHGNYLVLFVYRGPNDNPHDGPWTSCQEFPTNTDVNKIGPQQIKWENVRNSPFIVPNYVIIIPIQGQSTTAPVPSPLPLPA